MTAPDCSVPAHDPPQTSPVTRRRRSQSSTSTKSPPSISKRSLSPKVAFATAPLSADPKAVKNIAREVIRTLEGLGHLDKMDLYEQDCESDERDEHGEVEGASFGLIHQSTLNGQAEVGGPYVNGSAHSLVTNALAPAAVKDIARSRRETNNKIDWEIPRKLLHSSIGFITVYLYMSEANVKTIILVLWTALAVIIPVDLIRLRFPAFERAYERCLGFLMRDSEKNTINGVVWYILGVNFVLTFYPQDVATVAILILSWADTAASTIGRLLGSQTPRLPIRAPVLRLPFAPRKSLAGFLAATLTGICITVGFWGWIAPLRHNGAGVTWQRDCGVHTESSLGCTNSSNTGGWLGLGTISIVAGLVSGVAEALDLGPLDDNLTLPIISGGCILGFMKLLRYLSS